MLVSLLRTRITLVWLVLIGATALSWEMGHGIGFDDFRHASLAIILVSLVKVRFVILDFMELRHAPTAMRLVAEGWVLLLSVVLVTLYWTGLG